MNELNHDFSLHELTDACIKQLISADEDMQSASQTYDICLIEGKSVVNKEEELNKNRRTFGFSWELKKVNHAMCVCWHL